MPFASSRSPLARLQSRFARLQSRFARLQPRLIQLQLQFAPLTAMVILVLFSPAAGADSADLDRVMSELAKHTHGHVSFVERKYLAVLDQPVESSGELLYDAPDRLEKRTLRPKPESLVAENGIVTAQRGRHRYTLDLRQYPQIVPFIESIRATLAGDRQALQKTFRLGFDGNYDRWTLELVPLDAKVASTVKNIQIQGAADAIRSIEILESDGDRSLLSIGAEAGQ